MAHLAKASDIQVLRRGFKPRPDHYNRSYIT